MLDIGWTEIIVLAVVCLFVIGPKDIPKFLGYVGKIIAKIKGITRDFNETVDEAIKDSELDDIRKEIELSKKELDSTKDILNPTTEIDKFMNNEKKNVILDKAKSKKEKLDIDQS